MMAIAVCYIVQICYKWHKKTFLNRGAPIFYGNRTQFPSTLHLLVKAKKKLGGQK